MMIVGGWDEASKQVEVISQPPEKLKTATSSRCPRRGTTIPSTRELSAGEENGALAPGAAASRCSLTGAGARATLFKNAG